MVKSFNKEIEAYEYRDIFLLQDLFIPNMYQEHQVKLFEMINNLKINKEIKNGDYQIFKDQVEKFQEIETKEKIFK